MLTKKDVVKYYIALFNRIPEKEAVDNWYDKAIESKWSESELVNSLFNSAVNVVKNNEDLKDIYPQYFYYDSNSFISILNIVESIYKSLFNKSYEDDPNGIINWSMKIYNKQITLPEAIVSIEHFAEDVYNNKIDLKGIGYNEKEIESIEEAVNTFESRVEYAYKASKYIEDIKVDNDSLELLQESINLIHSEDDYIKVTEFLEDNLEDIISNDDKIVIIKEELNNEFIVNDSNNVNHDVLDTGENIGFVELPINAEINVISSFDLHTI